MKEIEYLKFDWENFIETLAECTTEMEMEMIYEKNRKQYLKEVPDFNDQYIRRLKEISYQRERAEYYQDQNTSDNDIRFFEDPFGVPMKDLDQLTQYRVGSELWRMLKWSHEKKHEHCMKLTRLWTSGFKIENPQKQIWSLRDRLFILTTLINFNVLPELTGIKSRDRNQRFDEFYDLLEGGGDRLSRLLSIILNTPSSSINDQLKNGGDLRDYLNFHKLKNSDLGESAKNTKAGIWFYSLEKIMDLFKGLTINNKYSKTDPQLSQKYSIINDYLNGIKDQYKEYFL